MNNESCGLLSGKYDSTKQRAVLLNNDRYVNYISYTMTMRLELLLTGRLVFTDAQFCDGLYFHWLANNDDEFKAFKELLIDSDEESKDHENKQLFRIIIKCRGDGSTNDLAKKMYSKQFWFSSIEDDELANAVFDLSNDFSEENLTECKHEKYSLLKKKFNNENATDDTIDYRKLIPYIYEITGKTDPVHEKIEDLNEYLEEMHTMLDKQYGQKSNISKKWDEYKELLKKVTNVKYSKWGYKSSDNGEWIADFHLDKCLEQSFPSNKTITYKDKMEELIENMNSSDGMDKLPLAKRYFARIRDELLRGIQNRSKITNSISEIEKLNEKNICEPNREKVKKLIREFRQLMNDRYNKATAYQHGCTFLDLCDYTDFDIHSIQKECIEIPNDIITNLSKLSWVEFTNRLNTELINSDSKLKEKFDTWMSAYKEFKKEKIDGLKKALNEYLDAINESLCRNADEKNFIPSNSFPWNIYNTCDLEARKEYSKKYGESGCYFIGGGSFEASEEGNEICILCVEEKLAENDIDMVILRLRMNKDASNDTYLDTLLAPVCNPLNGGSDGLYDRGIKI